MNMGKRIFTAGALLAALALSPAASACDPGQGSGECGPVLNQGYYGSGNYGEWGNRGGYNNSGRSSNSP